MMERPALQPECLILLTIAVFYLTYDGSYPRNTTSDMVSLSSPDEYEYPVSNTAMGLIVSKWMFNRTNIAYNISKYSKHLDSATIDKTIDDAFAIWGKHIATTFRLNRTNPVFDIQFDSGVNGDVTQFESDGRHTMAYAGEQEVHFLETEQWTDNILGDSYLFKVAVHEIGHLLGLGHSKNPDAVMYFNYESGPAMFIDLHSDDIARIQKLWDAKPNVTQRLSYFQFGFGLSSNMFGITLLQLLFDA